MPFKHPPQCYAGPSIALHWLTLVLLAAVYALIEWRGLAPKGTPLQADMKAWHFMLGLCVLGLTVLRLMLPGRR